VKIKDALPYRMEDFVPAELRSLGDPQTAFPAIAKDRRLLSEIQAAVQQIPTSHELRLGDARGMKLDAESVHLVLSSPPYWTLKEYRDTKGQLGHVGDYREFL